MRASNSAYSPPGPLHGPMMHAASLGAAIFKFKFFGIAGKGIHWQVQGHRRGGELGRGDSEGGDSDGARCALQSIAIWSHSATYMLTGVGR